VSVIGFKEEKAVWTSTCGPGK